MTFPPTIIIPQQFFAWPQQRYSRSRSGLRILHFRLEQQPEPVWMFQVRACVKRNFWLAKFLTSRQVRMHRAIFYISNTLRKLMIGA